MHDCPVCGYAMEDIPADYNICPCCGTEFGYNDAGISHAELREEWVKRGALWWSPVDPPPPGWNAAEQLKKLELKSA